MAPANGDGHGDPDAVLYRIPGDELRIANEGPRI
jgi:hypothetical protein